MDKTFAGCPVYVRHVEDVNLDKLQEQADGYVTESFFNEADGYHWLKFIVVSDKGKDAINQGWKVSNAYMVDSSTKGGHWNGVQYIKEVTAATFNHLAIVNDPRYDSVILTADEYKVYNTERLSDLRKVANSLNEGVSKVFEFFKKPKIEKADDISDITVKLDNGTLVSIADLVANANKVTNEVPEKKTEEKPEENVEKKPEDKSEAKEEKEEKSPEAENKEKAMAKPEDEAEMPMMANMDHHVACEGGSMPLKQMVAEHAEMKNAMSIMAKHMQAKKNDEGSDAEDQQESTEEAMTNSVKNSTESAAFEAGIKTDKKYFNELKNAHLTATEKPVVIDLEASKRGRNRYGSKS